MTTRMTAPAPQLNTLDELERFMDTDLELQAAYLSGIREIGSEWTDERLAESAYKLIYGENVDDLMQAWRWQRTLANPADPDHGRAWDVHEAVLRWKSKQQQLVACV